MAARPQPPTGWRKTGTILRDANAKGSFHSRDKAKHGRSRPQAAAEERGTANQQPDVLLDVSQLKVDEIHLEVDNLQAHVSLLAEVLTLLRLQVGADVSLAKVSLDIKGVDATGTGNFRYEYDHPYSEDELHQLQHFCAERSTYCLFNNKQMSADAARFEKLAETVVTSDIH